MFPDPEELFGDLLALMRSATGGAARGSQSIHTYSSGAGASVSVTSRCAEGRAIATVELTDADGEAIAGVPVRGTVRFSAGGGVRTVRFPDTDGDGRSEVTLEMVRPGTLSWTVEVEVGGSRLSAATSSTAS